jgi:lipopolysaccharide export system protein LptC
MAAGIRLILGRAAGRGEPLTIVSQIDARGSHAFTARRRNDGERMFRAAKRHSRLVRFLRVGIPVGVLVSILAVIVVATVLDPLRALAKLPINIGGLVVSGTKITMQQPRLTGYTQDSRPYVVNARAAAQDVTKPDVLELDDIRATMDMKDGVQYEVLAQSGLFENKNDKLTLHQKVLVNSTAYQAKLTEAVINMKTGHVVSDKPVEVTMTQGVINANRLEVINSGEVILFDKGVVMVLVPTDSSSQASPR